MLSLTGGAEGNENKSPIPDFIECVNVLPLTGSIKQVAFMKVKKGFQWSQHMKPKVNTEWCEKCHTGVMLKGKMEVTMKDGEKKVFEGGMAYHIPPNHDAIVHEDVEAYEFEDNHAAK